MNSTEKPGDQPSSDILANTGKEIIRGSARAIQQHWEQDQIASDVMWTVWTFRIERYDPDTGEHRTPDWSTSEQHR